MPQFSPLSPAPIDVISIQSQVIYGSVGNGIAYRTLLAKGLQALQVPTVLFGCPPYYGPPHGGVIPDDWFGGFLEDLLARGVAQQARAVIVGYLGNDSQCRLLDDWLRRVRALNPQVLIVTDPVMGDYGEGVYVNQRLVDCYRSPFLQLADGLTPNGFELEQISGTALTSREQIVSAARALLNDVTRWVLVTSAPDQQTAPQDISLLWVTADEVKAISHRKIDANVKGTGDMFTALLVSRLLAGEPAENAVYQAIDEVCAALTEAARYGWGEIGRLSTSA